MDTEFRWFEVGLEISLGSRMVADLPELIRFQLLFNFHQVLTQEKMNQLIAKPDGTPERA